MRSENSLITERSHELYQIFDRLKSRPEASIGASALRQEKSSFPVPSAVRTAAAHRYYEAARSFAAELASTSQTIANLAKLVEQQTIFHEGDSEIASLCSIVKSKLAQLHDKLGDLDGLKAAATGGASHEAQAAAHGETVLSTLRSSLVHASHHFKTLLERRTRRIKKNFSKHNQITSDQPQSFESALFRDGGASGGGDPQNQVATYAPNNLAYYQHRHEAVRQIEQSVNEVSEMFHDFARLVHEQEELVVRIDNDVDESLRNVNAGSNELLRYLANLSSNRGLIIKIFVVLFAFLLFFGFVVV